MKGKHALLLAPSFLLLGAFEVEANTSIRDLQQNAGVTISGTVTNVVGNEFIVDDGTGQMIVDAGPRWYHTIHVTQGERVKVIGEYDNDDFDAYQITRSNGEVMTIRDGTGRPPWAVKRE
jgi:uncharacterized protein YdeI (BOF family)